MATESLNELKAAFRVWRRQKRYSREAIPPELLSRARQAVAIHGMSAVVNATNFTRNGLSVKESGGAGKISRTFPTNAPSYSRLEVAAPTADARPVAEAETPAGMKLRIFQITPETLALLASLCAGGGR